MMNAALALPRFSAPPAVLAAADELNK